MIIKSMSRKTPSFEQIINYFSKDDGEPVLFHNLFGHDRMEMEDVIREFERNAEHLRARANGNAMYHEVISLAEGHGLDKEEAERYLADIGELYLQERAPDQLGYGVVHHDTKNVHLHLCVSANEIGTPQRVRLSKARFQQIQKNLERYVTMQYPQLRQRSVYDKARAVDRARVTQAEQEFKRRSGERSRKEAVKSRMHSIFAEARNPHELMQTLKAAGFELYVRGKTPGVIDNDGRRYRLKTLGVLEHFQHMNENFDEAVREQRSEKNKRQRKQREDERKTKSKRVQQEPAFEAPPKGKQADEEPTVERDEYTHQEYADLTQQTDAPENESPEQNASGERKRAEQAGAAHEAETELERRARELRDIYAKQQKERERDKDHDHER